jgi:hypothetical protein
VPFTVTSELPFQKSTAARKLKSYATHQLLFQSETDFIRQKHEYHSEKHISFLFTSKEAGLELNYEKLNYMFM